MRTRVSSSFTESNGSSGTLAALLAGVGSGRKAPGLDLDWAEPDPGSSCKLRASRESNYQKGRRAASSRQMRADSTLRRRKPQREIHGHRALPPTALSGPLQHSLPRCPRRGLGASGVAANGRETLGGRQQPCSKPMADSRTRGGPRGACARSNSGGRGPKFLLGSSTPTVWNLGPSQSEGQVDTSVLCEPQKGHIQEGGLCLRNKGCTQDIHILAKYEASRHKPKVISRRFTCPV